MGNQLAAAQSMFEPQVSTPAPNGCVPCANVWKQIDALQQAQDALKQQCPREVKVNTTAVVLPPP